MCPPDDHRNGDPSGPEDPADVCYLLDSSDRIVKVSDNWADFARRNGAGEMVSGALGRPLWDFITDPNVRHLYHKLLSRVRQGRSVSLPFRCDSPGRKRAMRIRIETRENGFVEIRTSVEHAEDRPPVPLLEGQTADEEQSLLSLCSWCKKVEVEGEWLEVEEAIEELELFDAETMPAITHGICTACMESVSQEIAAL